MKKLHRAGLLTALAALASLALGQQAHRHVCPWRTSSPRMLQNPPEEERPAYAGAGALTIGALGLVARARRR